MSSVTLIMLLGLPHCSTDRALWPLCLGRAALGGVLCYSYDAAWLSALQHRSGSVTPLYGRAALGGVLCSLLDAAWLSTLQHRSGPVAPLFGARRTRRRPLFRASCLMTGSIITCSATWPGFRGAMLSRQHRLPSSRDTGGGVGVFRLRVHRSQSASPFGVEG